MATLYPTFELAERFGRAIEIDAATVDELLARCVARFGDDFARELRRVAVLVNGRAIALLQRGKTPLGPGDVVWMVKAAGGG
jgi:molybdopterin converting factor small subunit